MICTKVVGTAINLHNFHLKFQIRLSEKFENVFNVIFIQQQSLIIKPSLLMIMIMYDSELFKFINLFCTTFSIH